MVFVVDPVGAKAKLWRSQGQGADSPGPSLPSDASHSERNRGMGEKRLSVISIFFKP